MKEKQILEKLSVVIARKEALLRELAALHTLENILESRIIAGMRPVIDLNGRQLTKDNIKLQIRSLAQELIHSQKQSSILVSIMDGALPFAAALQEELGVLDYSFQYETIQISSYVGTKSGSLSITSSLKIPVGGKDVIVVDDVCDTGKTYDALRQLLLDLGASSVKLMVLVDKRQERANEASHPSYVGFTVSKDAFVAGWGMDYEGLLRNHVKDIGAVDISTLPTAEESVILQSKKSLNQQLKACIAEENALNKSFEVRQAPLQQDTFYYDCLIGLACAGTGLALVAYGIYCDNFTARSIGGTLLAVVGVGLYNHGLFSNNTIRESKIFTDRASATFSM